MSSNQIVYYWYSTTFSCVNNINYAGNTTEGPENLVSKGKYHCLVINQKLVSPNDMFHLVPSAQHPNTELIVRFMDNLH